MEAALIPFYTIIIIIRWLWSHRLVALILIVILVITIGVNTYNSVTKRTSPSNVPVPAYQLIAPDKSIAPQVAEGLRSGGRIYYVVASHVEGEYLFLTDYFDYNQKAWKRHRPPEPPLQLQRSTVKLTLR